MTHGTFLWDTLRNIIKRPSKQQRECHAPKASKFIYGNMSYIFMYDILTVNTFVSSIEHWRNDSTLRLATEDT